MGLFLVRHILFYLSHFVLFRVAIRWFLMQAKATSTVFPSIFSFSESHKDHCIFGEAVKLEDQLWSPLMGSAQYRLCVLSLLPSPPRCSRAWWELKQPPWKEITSTLLAEVKEKNSEGKRRMEQWRRRKAPRTPPSSSTNEWHLLILNVVPHSFWNAVAPVVHAAPLPLVLPLTVELG